MPALDLVQQQMEDEARRRALMEYADGMEVSSVPAESTAEAPDDLAALAPASSRAAVARGAPQLPEAEADPYGDALTEAARRRFSHTGSNLGRGIIKAFTGVSDDSGQADRTAFEQAPVVEYLQRQQMADKKRALDLTAQKAVPKMPKPGKSTDPQSAESKAAQARLAPIIGDQMTEDEIATIPEAAEQLYLDAVAKKRVAEVTREGQVGVDKRSSADREQRARLAAQRLGLDYEKLSAAKKAALEKATEKDETQADAKETGLRKEFNGLPAVKNYELAAIAVDQVKRAAADDSPAGDIALVTNYMRSLDPSTGVKDQEFNNASKAGGFDDRARAAYERIISGKRLTPEMRKGFVTSATGLLESHRLVYEARKKQYEGLAPPGTASRVALPTGLDLSASPPPVPTPSTAPAESIREKIDLPDGSQLITYTNGRQVKRTPKKRAE